MLLQVCRLLNQEPLGHCTIRSKIYRLLSARIVGDSIVNLAALPVRNIVVTKGTGACRCPLRIQPRHRKQESGQERDRRNKQR
jgi:hypothetical protein